MQLLTWSSLSLVFGRLGRRNASKVASLLAQLRAKTGNAARVTQGLQVHLLERFSHDKELVGALTEANTVVDALIKEHGQSPPLRFPSASFRMKRCLVRIARSLFEPWSESGEERKLPNVRVLC
jgi:hypothetical protein